MGKRGLGVHSFEDRGQELVCGELGNGLSSQTEVDRFPSALKILCSHPEKEGGLTRAMQLGMDTVLG